MKKLIRKWLGIETLPFDDVLKAMNAQHEHTQAQLKQYDPIFAGLTQGLSARTSQCEKLAAQCENLSAGWNSHALLLAKLDKRIDRLTKLKKKKK